MTGHKEIQTLWKFVRGCLCNDVPKLQTTGAVWLKSRIFLLHGMHKEMEAEIKVQFLGLCLRRIPNIIRFIVS